VGYGLPVLEVMDIFWLTNMKNTPYIPLAFFKQLIKQMLTMGNSPVCKQPFLRLFVCHAQVA
jgi:hypothetical protein